jgi:hypothetical protein
MRSEKKAQRKWLYLGDEDVERLDKLVGAFPALNEAMVLGTLASAALKACEVLDYRALPSTLVVPETEMRLRRSKL